MIGTTFGRYDIMEELGHGGMSVVYRGVDRGLEREVAIKVLHSHLAKKAENRERLHREAKAIARLKHPNILEIYDYGDDDSERAYIVMEYVAGSNLRQLLDAHGPMPAEYCALLAVRLCEALAEAHANGIIHRDIKPENVMVSRSGQVKLADFGIAHIFDAETMTQTGSLLGSPAHMAPEMIEGERVDERADLFALGTVLYWLCTGQLPFEGRSAPQILKRVLEGIFKNPEAVNPKVGQCFGDIIRRCLAYEPADRYSTAREVIEDLERFLARVELGDPTRALTEYLVAPEATRDAFEARVVKALERCATAALARDEPTEAFRVLNRILAYEPDNALVRAQLARLQRRGPTPKHIAIIAAATIMMIIAGVFTVRAWDDEKPPSPDGPPEEARADNEGEAIASPAREESRAEAEALALAVAAARGAEGHARALTRAVAEAQSEQEARRVTRDRARRAQIVSASVRIVQARTLREALAAQAPVADMGVVEPDAGDMGRAQQEEPARTHTYKFRLLPVSAVLSIDGQDYEAARANHGIELEQGKSYTLRVRCARGCEPHTERITIEGPQTSGPKHITLAWRNGIVKIRAKRDSLIYLPGEDRRVVELSGGREYLYPVVFGDAASARQPKRALTFTIYDRKQMQRSHEQTVTLEPGIMQVIEARF